MTILCGLFTLGRDMEVRYTTTGEPIGNLSLAYNFGKKDEQGNRQTQWVDAKLFGPRAESSKDYLTKGKRIFATLTEPHINTHTGKDGQPKNSLTAKVQEFEFATSKPDGGPAPRTGNGYQQSQRVNTEKTPAGDLDSEIPF